MKHKKTPTTLSNNHILEKGNMDTPKEHDHSLSWFGTDTSITSGGVW
jgi:hypothetical protein